MNENRKEQISHFEFIKPIFGFGFFTIFITIFLYDSAIFFSLLLFLSIIMISFIFFFILFEFYEEQVRIKGLSLIYSLLYLYLGSYIQSNLPIELRIIFISIEALLFVYMFMTILIYRGYPLEFDRKIFNIFKKKHPTLKVKTYEEILGVYFDMAIIMERNPKGFMNLDEEGIRDHFLMHLNAYFRGKATGETFNKKGKTDILIRHENQNIFIAECKFWRGPELLKKAIDQILSYCTWRDTKTTILIFNKETQISTILNKVDQTIREHNLYSKKLTYDDVNLNQKGIFGYIFNLPEDRMANISLTIMVFDIPMT